MATRTVTVRLRADISHYTRGMRQAADNTSRLAGAGATVSTALVAGFAVAAAAAAKFDKSLSGVRAVSGASSQEMKQLRAAALDAGKSTAFTATQAADAEAELARAGVSVANITGGALKGSLALAASGQIDLSEAAVTAAQAMNTFGLKGKDVTHIADVLSAGANKSAADVHGLGTAMRMGGLLAHQTGLSLEETVGTLSAFADHALIGSDAGTSLKTMLQRLTPQSKEAQVAMDKIGLSAYDSSGKFVGLSEFAGRLKTSFSKLTPEARNSAMATIFGSDAVRSATILYELGSEGVNRYTKSVNDQGAAARMASIQTDNLSGDFERLRGAIEVALIEGGSSANGALRGMTQWVTRLVNAYNDLPPELQHVVTLFTGIGGAAGLAATGLILLLPRIAATRAALASMGVTAARARAAMMGFGRLGIVVTGLAAVGWGVSKLVDEFAAAPPDITKMTNSLVNFAQQGKVGGELARNFGKDMNGFGEAVARVAHPSVLKRLKDIPSTLDPFRNTDLTRSTAKLDALDTALSDLVSSGSAGVAAKDFSVMAREAEASGTSTEKLRTLLPKYASALTATDTQQKLTADGQKKLGDQATMTADDLKNQKTAAEQLTDALKTLNGINIGAAEKEISFRQSLADLTTAVKENGHSLDVTSDKGRKVKSAFLDAAQAAMDHAQAVAEQKNSVEAGNSVLEKDIGTLKKAMHQAGFSADAINKLTSAYAQLPTTATTTVTAKTDAAVADLETVKRKLAGVPAGKSITVRAPSEAAIQALKDVGFKVKTLPNRRITITVPTSGPAAAARAIQTAINGLHGKSITNTIITNAIHKTSSQPGPYASGYKFNARGGIRRFANGTENHVAQIAKPGDWRVWAEDETGGEAYIPLAPSKRGRSRKIAEETVRRLGGKGIAWYAQGGLNGFTYTPGGAPSLAGAGDAKTRYDNAIQTLKDAWAKLSTAMADAKKKANSLHDAETNLSKVRHRHHTRAQLDAAEARVTKAKRDKKAADSKVSADRRVVSAADKALGLRAGAKAPSAFNLSAYLKQLTASAAATDKWQKNLTKIGARGGKEIQDLLEGMGEDGYMLVNSLARASDKQFKDIVAKLQKTGGVAKATLADFNKQLGASTTQSAIFAADLEKLASQGFGELAQALASQGDDAAQALAHQSAGSSKDASAANAAVKRNQATLSGDDLTNALILLTTLRAGTGRGYADLISAGLDTATIKALVPRIMDKISALPDANKATFLGQFAGQGGVAMARGGILSRPTAVLGGEAGVPESWIPHDGSSRSRSILAATAGRFGYSLVPAGRYSGGRASTADLAREVSRQITINLYGAKQSSAEQAKDIARHLEFVS